MSGDAYELTRELKAHARELGFDAVGVCTADEFSSDREFLISRERHGIAPSPFEWPDIDERVEPSRILPGVKSIVAVAMSYLCHDEPEPGGGPRGELSRYCRGTDYHTVLEERLGALGRWLESRRPGVHTLVHVDVGAPIERSVAVRAGLGRYGKSTNLIIRGLGTWTFLGELFTTEPLLPDREAVWNVCGSCTRCLDACPTGCLTPWTMDSTRCLSYVNQMDGHIPLEMRASLGVRLFGCDDCQDVCPYNSHPATDRHPEFAALDEPGAQPDLRTLLTLDDAEFQRTWSSTAAAWRGLETVQRNALVALGNSGDPRALEPLCSALPHQSPVLRAHAAWALGRLATLRPDLAAQARRTLSVAMSRETDPEASRALAHALRVIPAESRGARPLDGPVPKRFTLEDFTGFDVPTELIAQRPADPRDSSRLMVLDRKAGTIEHRIFRDLPDVLDSTYAMVLNNSKVTNCKLDVEGPAGARHAIYLLFRHGTDLWQVSGETLGAISPGEPMQVVGSALAAELLARADDGSATVRLALAGASNVDAEVQRVARVPLPPYIADLSAEERYQTVYAKHDGSVAAPTAGLHFSEAVFGRLGDRGVTRHELTLHVGYGTFAHVLHEDLAVHRMPEERFTLDAGTAQELNERRAGGARLLTVGTTATRVLESCAHPDGTLVPRDGSTALFIYPPYEFRAVDALLTNFHMPGLTPIMLVCAFAGYELTKEAYHVAIAERYRFYSFGDAMLVL